MCIATYANAFEPPVHAYSDYFRYYSQNTVSVSAIEGHSVVRYRMQTSGVVDDPRVARFIVNGNHNARFHYEGVKSGAYSYLLRVPESYSGSVVVEGYVGDRTGAVAPGRSISHSNLMKYQAQVASGKVWINAHGNDTSWCGIGPTGGACYRGSDSAKVSSAANLIAEKLMNRGLDVGIYSQCSGSSYSSSNVFMAMNSSNLPSSSDYACMGGYGAFMGIVNLGNRFLDQSGTRILLNVWHGARKGYLNEAENLDDNDYLDTYRNDGIKVLSAHIGIYDSSISGGDKRQFTSANAVDIDWITSSASSTVERTRNVSTACSGSGCVAQTLDNKDPEILLTASNQCGYVRDPSEISVTLHDQLAGIDMDNTDILVRFSDGSVRGYPVAIANNAHIEDRESRHLAPTDVVLHGDSVRIQGSPALASQFDQIFNEPHSRGGGSPFEIIVRTYDADGNAATEVFEVELDNRSDTDAPMIGLSTGGQGNTIRNVTDFAISVTDDQVGVVADTISIELEYNGQIVTLPLQGESDGEVFGDACLAKLPLRYDFEATEQVMMQSEVMGLLSAAYRDGMPVTIRVQAEDFVGNHATRSFDLDIADDTVAGTAVNIPAVPTPFMVSGLNTYTIPSEELVFESISDIEYYAQLKSEGDRPISVNGVEVVFGQSRSLGLMDISTQLELNIHALGEQAGSSTLLLVPTDGRARAVEIPVTSWRSSSAQSVSSSEPVEIFERVSVDLGQQGNRACTLTSDLSEAESADQVRSPVCLVEWTQMPAGMFGYTDGTVRATGFLPETKEYSLEYRISLFDPSGIKHTLEEASLAFQAKPAADRLVFRFGGINQTTHRLVEEVEARLVQASGPNCSEITMSRNRAMDLAGMNRPACLVEWVSLPDGIQEIRSGDEPSFYGTFQQTIGDANVVAKVSTFTTIGDFVELMTLDMTIELSDPPAPHITFTPARNVGVDYVGAPITGGEAGRIAVYGVNADMVIEVRKDGQLQSTNLAYAGFGDSVEHSQRLTVEPADLWATSSYEITAYYEQLPSLRDSHSLQVIAIPGANIVPELSSLETQMLSNNNAAVEVAMGNRLSSSESYDIRTMGEWDLRVVNERRLNDFEALTQRKRSDASGKAQFSLEFPDETQTMKLYGEALLRAPIDGLDLTVRSSRPSFMTVLNAGPIGAEVRARNVTGQSPVNVMASVRVTNGAESRLIGDVIWEARNMNEGADWTQLESPYGDRIFQSFSEGHYHLRARTTNSLTGEVFVTETVNVISYKEPNVTLDAPRNAFIGSEAKVRIISRDKDEELDPLGLEIEWSLDGESWESGGVEYSVTSDIQQRVPAYVRVRPANTPEGVPSIYTSMSTRVAFQELRQSRARILGPTRIEAGSEVQFQALNRAPYTDMDVELEGYFLLPDGTRIDGDDITFVPTLDDVRMDRPMITYVNWIKGYEGEIPQTTTDKRLRVWNYQWPTWGMNMNVSTLQAPATMSIRVRPTKGRARNLEGLDYQWELPDGVQINQDRYPERRDVTIDEPGTYTIRVHLSDDRGNRETLLQTVEVTEPDPWEVNFMVRYSSEERTAPLGIYMRPYVNGGHPEDRASRYSYYINGEYYTEGRVLRADLNEGSNTITIAFDTEFGEKVEHDFEVAVLPNTPPICDIHTRDYGGGRWRLQSDCVDPGGEIVQRIWTVEGQQLPFGNRRITIQSEEGQARPIVTLRAIDNGGLESVPVVW